MTRINVVGVSSLCNKHLIAEYSEMLRLPRLIRNWDNNGRKGKVPPTYRMGTGHVRFFYDKLAWIINRHYALCEEMLNRGFEVNYILEELCGGISEDLFNDWWITDNAILTNVDRIVERLKGIEQPTWTSPGYRPNWADTIWIDHSA